MPVESNTNVESATELIFSRGTLVSLYIGRFHGVKKLHQEDVLHDDINEDALYLGHKKLLPKHAMDPLVMIEGMARRALAARSLEFPVSGARFVQYTTIRELLTTLGNLRTNWFQAVEALLQQYPRLAEEQLLVLDKQAEALMNTELSKNPSPENRIRLADWFQLQRRKNRELYPDVQELRDRFPFEWRLFRVSAVEGQQINMLTIAEANEIQQRFRADMQSWVRDAARMMHQALGEAARNAREVLERHGKLTPRNLRPLFEAFESFAAVDFTGQSDFHNVIRDLRQRYVALDPDGSVNYSATAENVNGNDYSRQMFNELLGSMASLAVDQVAEQAGIASLSRGTFGRVVELD